eukprot:5559625-Amphidinium_carterae.1
MHPQSVRKLGEWTLSVYHSVDSQKMSCVEQLVVAHPVSNTCPHHTSNPCGHTVATEVIT